MVLNTVAAPRGTACMHGTCAGRGGWIQRWWVGFVGENGVEVHRIRRRRRRRTNKNGEKKKTENPQTTRAKDKQTIGEQASITTHPPIPPANKTTATSSGIYFFFFLLFLRLDRSLLASEERERDLAAGEGLRRCRRLCGGEKLDSLSELESEASSSTFLDFRFFSAPHITCTENS